MSAVPIPAVPSVPHRTPRPARELAMTRALAGETPVLSAERGLVPLEALVDQPVTLFTTAGWQAARVSCLGRGPATAIALAPVQRYPKGAGFRAPTASALPRRLVVGGRPRIAIGDLLPRAVVPWSWEATLRAAPAPVLAGYRAGLFFGDGTRAYVHDTTATAAYSLRLCGPKAALLELFRAEPFQIATPASTSGDPVVTIRSALELKALPLAGHGAGYLAGFIRGWLRADGAIEPSGALVLSTQDAEAAAWLVAHAALAGLVVLSHTSGGPAATNYGRRSAPLHRLRCSPAPGAWRVTTVQPLTGTLPLYGVELTGDAALVLGPGVVAASAVS